MNNIFIDRIKKLIRCSSTQMFSPHIIILHKYKAIYFAIPKVANSSFKSVCVDLLEIDLPVKYWKPNFFNTGEYGKQRDKILITRDKIYKYQDYLKFAFVRNPWDRLVSCYREKIRDSNFEHPYFVKGVGKSLLRYGIFKANMPFEEFVHAIMKIPDDQADNHFRSQFKFVCDDKGNLVVDHIGKFENLQEGFSLICNEIGIKNIEMPHLLKSDRDHYTSYYTDRLKYIVARRYAKDIELFGYAY